MVQNQLYLDKMSEEIKIRKSHIIGGIGLLLILIFVIVAVRNVFSNNVGTELVKGGDSEGNNNVVLDGDTQIINLGVANYNYDPSTIKVKQGQKVKIVGNMNQLQGCLRAFSIPKLGLSKVFNNGDNVLEFTAQQKGSFGYSCSMGMGRGTLIIE